MGSAMSSDPPPILFGITITTPILFGAMGGFFLLVFLVWFFAKITASPPDYWADQPLDYVRGGCVLIVVAAIGLVALAAVVWAWRYLFGG